MSHPHHCALCGSFMRRLRDGETSIRCPRCRSEWEIGKSSRGETIGADLTVPQAALLMGLSGARVRILCAQGKLRARKLGRDWLVASPIRRTAGKPGRPRGRKRVRTA